MNIVNHSLRLAFRRVMSAFQSTRQKHRDAMRPIPDQIVEKYHRAMWALDVLGPGAKDDRDAMREMWQNATSVAANASGPDGAAIAADIIKVLNEQCEKILRQCEKDPHRPEWEKQRDFLVGSLRRVRRACVLNDTDHLHFYRKSNEVFNVDLQHPQFQVGYFLWQGIREELKAAVTFTVFRDRPLHLRVDYLVTQIRAIIRALEHNDLQGFDYTKSALHLSKEQEGRIMWEAVRAQIAKVIANSGVAEAA
jgi:hypothetical protein